MASTLLLTGDSVRPAKLSLRGRWAARVAGGDLDRALARGVAPDHDAALQHRAHTLVGAPMRRRLADRLEWTMRRALEHRGRRGTRVVADRGAVLGAAPELEAILETLRGPEPVSPAGVARVVALLTDGTGPLYVRDAEPELAVVAAETVAGLESGGSV